ncbi:tyrosine-type recombinase/integrase [Phosphitispora fastidiosa]|uniref:tyrosine-type recombinase/integrase n=1 Tax=Phosphitispora fastidiosa TaxID=2837202 RepID=UPI001E49CA72|nr:tyrosine-type recombinase/integrase [Phosphitispora fastidiosa]MBU7006194.1 integrase [Phosphitispora fastidiosa]
MGKKSVPSPTRQVELCLKSLESYGQSKHEAKIEHNGEYLDGIYSHKTMKTYMNLCCTFSKWAKAEHGVKKLINLKPEITEKYFEKLKAEGKSPWTLQTVRSALRKLETGVKVRFQRTIEIVPKNLTLPIRERKARKNRGAYSREDADRIIGAVRKENYPRGLMLEVQDTVGLRIQEVTKIRVHDIDFKKGVLTVKGKGGRVRQLPVPQNILKKFREVIERENLTANRKIFTEKIREVERQVKRICQRLGIPEKGTHGFRHHYAISEYLRLRMSGLTDRQARLAVSRLLGHNRLDVTYSYIPREFTDLANLIVSVFHLTLLRNAQRGV